eukprot:310343-Pyramimonas_sp.AAC.1
MRAVPLRPSVELPWRPRNAVLFGRPHANASTGAFGGAPDGATGRCTGRGDACGQCRQGRWSSLGGHET